MTNTKIARVSALTIVSLVFFISANLSQAKDKELEVTVLDPFVEMRTGPGRGYPIFHVAEKGEAIVLLKKRTDWYKARTRKGQEGWIKRDHLHATLGPDGPELVFALPGREEYRQRKWEIGVLGGDFAGARGLTNYLGYHLTENISAELKFTQAFGPFFDNKLGSINLAHQPFPSWYVSPFFTLGTGMMLTNYHSNLVPFEDLEDPILTVGGGFFIYVSRSFLLRLEFNEHKVLTTTANNKEVEEWKAGISVFF